jgi:hypothetical protein
MEMQGLIHDRLVPINLHRPYSEDSYHSFGFVKQWTWFCKVFERNVTQRKQPALLYFVLDPQTCHP